MNTREEFIEKSRISLYYAAKFQGSDGNGRLGWLWLLSAIDYDSQNMEAMYNLVNNYLSLHPSYSILAYSELLHSGLSTEQQSFIMPTINTKNRQQLLNDYLEKAKEINFIKFSNRHLCTFQSFITLVHSWNLAEDNQLKNIIDFSILNDGIYRKTIDEYIKLKKEKPFLDSTQLNHELFKVQMSKLEHTSSYWGNFKDVPGFSTLISIMRKASIEFLEKHGIIDSIARYKAIYHPLVVWVSVHTKDSVHQPHVTDDALIGGVYYVKTPKWSGKLELYDPRGKQPLRDLTDPTSLAVPPFHRTVVIQPHESKLILFPGWLVHSVLRSSHAEDYDNSEDNNNEVSEENEYRVSLSMNLKGEWQDTAALHQTNCP
eukprot:gene8190-11079_t